ncbi:MAG TPA: YjbH domain-containing protein, partial [Trinickia sp.]|nr:YjbH domain-containing protein [Trinickia sp.]
MRATRPSPSSPLAHHAHSTRRKRLRAQPSAIGPRAAALSAALAFSSSAHAAGDALNAFGQSGGLVIPYGFALPQGAAEAQYNNYIDPRYARTATGSQVYWGGVGLLPYVEVSAGLANYPGNVPAPFFGADHFVLRHLMGNVKAEVPQFFRWQPAIAFGVSDIGGQTHFFRSKYAVISQAFGPATFTLGYGHGDRLDGVFGGAALALGRTGLSLLAEDDAKTPYLGVRYASPAIHWLADTSVVGTVMRSMRSTDGAAPRVSISVGIRIPLGRRFDAARCAQGLCEGDMAREDRAGLDKRVAAVEVAAAPADSAAAVPDPIAVSSDTAAWRERTALRVPIADDMAAAGLPAPAPVARAATAPEVPAAAPEIVPADLDTSPLDTIFRRLVDAGLERVRVGMIGHELIVEYENHRYGQNEADALGIVLGVASEYAPAGIDVVRAVIEKAGEPLGEVSVARAAYTQFLEGDSSAAARASLT